MYIDLSGIWQVTLPNEGPTVYTASLPGSLDENQIGHADEPNLASRLTRAHTYDGPAVFSSTFDQDVPEGRLFLEVERARKLSLSIDGTEIAPLDPVTLSSASVFEVTGVLQRGSEITFTSDNTYPGWPHDAIYYSSAATDETQTNWNGLLGYIRLRNEKSCFIEKVSVYPHGSTVDVHVDVNLAAAADVHVTVSSVALAESLSAEASLPSGRHVVILTGEARADAARWDEYEGNLHLLTAALTALCEEVSEKTVSFGLRDFSWNEEGRFTLNGRVIFIRSEANCCEFPETGHAPMDVDAWLQILQTYKSYGINCMRFHSHCPPEAAFTAADQLGILMQPELSHWNPRTAFEDPLSQEYYRNEALAIVAELANHPSFVMLTFGNELWAGDEGHEQMHELLHLLHNFDTTRLYAVGSNVHYGQIGCDPDSDFYASQKYFSMDLRGTFGGMGGEYGGGMSGFINREYPSATHTYNDTMAELRKVYKKPVFSFEVGQFEVLPDFDEIEDFHGVRLPVNLEIVRDRVADRSLLPRWKEYVEATGELSLLGYRAEIEAVLRTPGMSGISLLGLQDFTGQGTALVGMLNSHLQPKPFAFARPERFHRFFASVVPLALLPAYTTTVGETLTVPVDIANYGRKALDEPLHYEWKLGDAVIEVGTLSGGPYSVGALHEAGRLSFTPKAPGRYDLVLSIADHENDYPLWVYEDAPVVYPDSVHVVQKLEEALPLLEEGSRVFLSPRAEKDVLPHSIENQFTTDFWSVGTFKGQEGGMGFLIDASHPALDGFPTETHSNWQWWAMSNGRGVQVPKELTSIVTQMDCYAYLRPMTALFEANVGNGKLLFSSMGLLENTRYPEVRALIRSLLAYMDSGRFAPSQDVSIATLKGLFEA